MKEKIYTIPVTDAFREDCECPLCLLEIKLENDYTDYTLGPSLMEPDGRMETNEKGFCLKHYELLYNKQHNRLGLGLIIDTHMVELNKSFNKLFKNKAASADKSKESSLFKSITQKISSRAGDSDKLIDGIINELDNIEKKCTICSKLEHTMNRYVDVLFYLWSHEEDFRKMFSDKKGFCLKHFKLLLEGAKKYLSEKEKDEFLPILLRMQKDNMDRIQKEVNWFTQKFDYQNHDASWGNSKDAVPRSIQKLVGHCELK